MKCDQCEAMMIQGVFCHETGCPNQRKRWDPDSQQWRAVRECFECGYEVWADEPCCEEV